MYKGSFIMKCKICGFEGKSLVSHLRKHNISTEQYKKEYNVDKVHSMDSTQRKYLSELWTNRMKDRKWIEKYSKNRKSIWDYKYWMENGMNEIEAKKMVKSIQSNNSKKRDYSKSPSVLSKQFYLLKGFSIEEAEKTISKIQSKLSSKSSKFSGKKHSQKSKEKISQSMSSHIHKIGIGEWSSHFGDLSDPKYRSNNEIEIFNFINEITQNCAEANTFVENYNVDVLYKNKIIDYFGIYWHCKQGFYDSDYYHPHKKKFAHEIRKEDRIRVENLKKMGYDVMTVWEDEYIKTPNIVKENIKKFIYDS